MMEQLYRTQWSPFLKWVMANRGSEADALDAFHDAWLTMKGLLDVRADINNLGAYFLWVAKTKYMHDCKRKNRFIPTDFNQAFQYESEAMEADDDSIAINPDIHSDPQNESYTDEEMSDFDLERIDELKYDPEHWGIVRTCLEDLSQRRKTILTLYFNLRFLGNPFTEAEFSDQIAAHCRALWNTKDTRNSINVDKTRGFEDLRAALYRRFPDKARWLKSVFDRHKSALKAKSQGSAKNQQA